MTPWQLAVAAAFWLSIMLGFYTYIGYPIAVAALARLRPKCTPPDAPLPQVTLLIAAFNEQQVIAAKLDHVLALY